MATAKKAGKRITTQDILDRDPSELSVPIRGVHSVAESICLGLRQAMLDIEDHGGVATGTGLGTDFIILKWNDRQAVLRGSEILRAWVATFAPEDAARMDW